MLRAIVTLALLIAAATFVMTPADAGSLDSLGETRSARPLFKGSETYQLRDSAGRSTGTARPLYQGSDSYTLRDRAGRSVGSVAPLYRGSDQLVIRDRGGRRAGTLDRN